MASDGRVWTVLNDAPWTGDAVITKVVAMWKEGHVEIPSYAFRKALVEANARNAEAEVLLNTDIGLRTRKMGELF